MARGKQRQRLNNIATASRLELNEHKMSQMLYGASVSSKKNMIGVKSFKQAIQLPDKLPSLAMDKVGTPNRPSILNALADKGGPVKAKNFGTEP